jgi:cell division protein FtsQ
MDGGGRFALPPRKPRSIAIAGRAQAGWRGLWSARKRRRLHDAGATPPWHDRIIARLESLAPRGAGITLTIVVLAGSGLFGAAEGGHVAQFTSELRDARDGLANALGFRITSVTINGRKQLSQDEVLAIGGVTGRRSLLFLDATDVRERRKANPWIADATVLKLYPDRLNIDVTERSAFAVWQDDSQLAVIADDGAVLEPFVAGQFRSLPLVVGNGAAPRAKAFLAVLARYPQLKEATKAIILVGQRRWNLRLASGLDVRLPETDVTAALDRLVRLDRDDHLLSRDIVAVDLRLPDRVTVRLSDEAAQARVDALKARARKKATDA